MNSEVHVSMYYVLFQKTPKKWSCYRPLVETVGIAAIIISCVQSYPWNWRNAWLKLLLLCSICDFQVTWIIILTIYVCIATRHRLYLLLYADWSTGPDDKVHVELLRGSPNSTPKTICLTGMISYAGGVEWGLPLFKKRLE